MRRLHGRSLPWALVLALLAPWAVRAAELTATEQRWLQGAWPVVVFARESRVPLDIVVQPQPTPGMAPLALAFVDGRCKLVLSMRGNAEAQRTLERIEPELLDAALELMAAHELGHCRRYLDGAWHGLPAGFVGLASRAEAAPPNAAIRLAVEDMRATRREEAYGDLVGLAWTQARRPALYARLHAWLLADRSAERLPGGHHDTLPWLRLAADGRALEPSAAAGSMFDAAARLWRAGLGEAED